MHDYGPMIFTVSVAVVVLLGLAYVARSTRNKLVKRESTPDAVAAYTRPSTPQRTQAQLDAREVRLQQAATAHRMYVWCVVLLALICAATAFAALSDHMSGVVWYLCGIALLAPAALLWWRGSRNVPVFPDLPEREVTPVAAESTRDDAADTNDVDDAHGSTPRAERAKRARRRAAAASRRANRQR